MKDFDEMLVEFILAGAINTKMLIERALALDIDSYATDIMLSFNLLEKEQKESICTYLFNTELYTIADVKRRLVELYINLVFNKKYPKIYSYGE